nr:MAG TPA: hypothetical protein [Caudoviricetes sp.]
MHCLLKNTSWLRMQFPKCIHSAHRMSNQNYYESQR